MVTQVFIDFQGFGMLLMEEAERIARDEHGSVKIAVISGRLTNSSRFVIIRVMISMQTIYV